MRASRRCAGSPSWSTSPASTGRRRCCSDGSSTESGRDRAARIDAETALALVYLQTNRFTETHGLFAGVAGVEFPIWDLMRSFGDVEPYRLDWSGDDQVTVPFTQTTDWELPSVAIEVDGVKADARLDTGGELLTLDRGLAEAIGVEPVASATGVFAGGARGEVGYGRVDAVSVGGLVVRNVPVAVLDLDRPVIGTGFLRQFLADDRLSRPPARAPASRRRRPRRRRRRGSVRPRGHPSDRRQGLARRCGAADVRRRLRACRTNAGRSSRRRRRHSPRSGSRSRRRSRTSARPAPGHVPLQVARFPIRRLGARPARPARRHRLLRPLPGRLARRWPDSGSTAW